MEYDPNQVEILIKKVAYTLGDRLSDLSKNQELILENQLNDSMLVHQGNAGLITLEDIEVAYEIATVRTIITRQFFMERDVQHN